VLVQGIVLVWLLIFLITPTASVDLEERQGEVTFVVPHISLKLPVLALHKVPFDCIFEIDWIWNEPDVWGVLPDKVEYTIFTRQNKKTKFILSGSFSPLDNQKKLIERHIATIEVSKYGNPDIIVNFTFTNSVKNETYITVIEDDTRVMPGWVSIIPPLVIIALAIITRQVLISLFIGIWTCATLVHNYNPGTALIRSLDHYLPAAMTDSGKSSIFLFTLLLDWNNIQIRSDGITLQNRTKIRENTSRWATAHLAVECDVVY